MSVLFASAAHATTFQRTLTSDSLVYRDSYLKQDRVTEQHGSDNTMVVQASTNGATWNGVVSFALPTLGNVTITSARLQVRQSAGSNGNPIVARVLPVAESWSEFSGTWNNRQSFQPWQQPGGTVAGPWVSRRLLSNTTASTFADWEIGPIVNRWQYGELSNNGVLIRPDDESGNHTLTFDTRETFLPSSRPRLVLRYTDSPPAIHAGTAEIQPPAVKANTLNARFVLWVDADAGTVTPSGTPTGFDRVILDHFVGFQVVALDSVRANGSKLSSLATGFTAGSAQTTFQLPRLSNSQRVAVYFRANVNSGTLADGTDLVTSLDDSATPGAEAQSLWPGNADGVARNGDDWTLAVVSGTAAAIVFMPDTLTVSPGQCTPLDLFGIDASGNRFSITPDSIRVLPTTLGTVTPGGPFCALALGTARVIATYGGSFFRDTATVFIAATALPKVEQVALRNRAGVATAMFTPGDTVLCDVSVSDADGFQDVKRVDLDLSLAGHSADVAAPAYRARLRWQRGAAPAFTLLDPSGTSWRALPALSSVDTVTNAGTAQLVRFAFLAGQIARAATGQWSVLATAADAAPADTGSRVLNGITSLPRLAVTAQDPSAAFNSGPPGATGLPLAQPSSSRVTLQMVANTDATVQAAVGPLVGQSAASDTLFTSADRHTVAWGPSAVPTSTWLDTAWTAVSGSYAAPTAETPVAQPVYLWINHPSGASVQSYSGPFRWRAAAAGGAVSGSVTLPITATVSTAPRAASSATAEVSPTQVTAGSIANVLHVWLRPQIAATETGVNRVFATLPAGYGAPSVSAVSVNGTSASYADSSRSGIVDVYLPAKVTSTSAIDVRVKLDAPTVADPTGSAWIVRYDDTGSIEAPQPATEGDADGVANDNSWSVRVAPGAPAAIVVKPDQATVRVDSSRTFVAIVTDAWGNPVTAAATWSVQGAIGVIGTSSGMFTATVPGAGTVTARQGSATGRADVTTLPTRGLDARVVTGPATMYQGQAGAVISVDLENLAAGACSLDTLRLMFSRASSGDANRDFVVTPIFSLPAVLAGGARGRFAFRVDVSATALTAPLSVSARSSGIDSASAIRVSDALVDSTLAVDLRSGGIQVSASPLGVTLRPGSIGAPFMALTLRNLYPEARTLRSLRLHNTTQGPGTRAQLDAGLGELALFADDGDARFSAAADTLLQRSAAQDTVVDFTALTFMLGAGATRTLYLTADVPLDARDGDLANLAILRATELVWLESNTSPTASWPVTMSGALPIDGMTAAQVRVWPTPSVAVAPGSRRNPALDVTLPANGYQSDVLERLGIEHQGDAVSGSDVSVVEAWRDDGDGLFNATVDRRLGALSFTGSRWELTGLSESVPLAGARVFFTADVAATAVEGRSFVLALPAGTDHAIGMRSGNSGPLDAVVSGGNSLTISGANRVAIVTSPADSSAVAPGTTGAVLLHLIATNRYATPRRLLLVDLENSTSGPGSIAERDGELRGLTLRVDGDGNGRLDDLATDPAVGTVAFASGRATFTGLSVSLPAGLGVHLFVTGDVSVTGARDGDRLAVRLPDASSVVFDTAAVVVGTWPIGTNGRLVDGFPAAGVTLFATPIASVSPGDGPLLAFDASLPGNGYSTDVLQRLTLVNRGTALAADLSQVGLWRDGGDGVFDAGLGDDRWVTGLAGSDSLWIAPVLSEPLGTQGNRYHVSVSLAAGATDGRTVQLALPVLGAENASTNDGPTDRGVTGTGSYTITTSPLVATLRTPLASVLGGTVQVRLGLRNVGPDTITAIVPGPVAVSGTGAVSLLTGPAPASITLAPAQADSFSWQYRADGVGDVRFTAWAQGTEVGSGLTRRSASLTSAAHRIYAQATNLDLFPTQTMPVSVNVGQRDIVPLSLSFSNPGGSNGSDARITRLRLKLEDENGVDIVPVQLLARVEVREGSSVYLTKTVLEASGSIIDLPLATPVTVSNSEPTTIGLYMDLLSATSVPSFRVSLVDATTIVAEDATSGAPLTTVIHGASYPVVSAAARVVASATSVDVQPGVGADHPVTRGHAEVSALRFALTNPGVQGVGSDVRVTSLSAMVVDSLGRTVSQPGLLLTRVVVRSGARTHLDLSISSTQDSTVRLPLSLPLTLPANLETPLEFAVTLADSATPGRYLLRLADSTTLEARDVNTRALVPARYAVAPLVGDTLIVQRAARTLVAAGSPRMPASLVVGESNVLALSAVFRHPDAAGTAAVRVDSVVVELRDESRRLLSPDTLLNRIAVNWNGVRRGQVLALPSTGGRVSVPLAGAVLAAGDSASLEFVVDVDPGTPSGSLELGVSAAGIVAVEANTGLPLAVVPAVGADLPLLSGLGRLQAPGRDLSVGLESRIPAGLTANPVAVPVALLPLRNASPNGDGTIQVESLVMRAADVARQPLALGLVAERMEAWVGGVKWAESALLTPDSTTATLVGATRISVATGSPVDVGIRLVARAGATRSGFRIGLDRPDVRVVQSSNAQLTVFVRPQEGATFPLWTETSAFSPASLTESYSNFPNPFAAGRQSTTFAFYLPRPGNVTLRLLTAHGERVATLLDGAACGAGLRQQDRWDGRNGRGETVYNGVYVAELTVRYDDGTGDRVLRKVAVVR